MNASELYQHLKAYSHQYHLDAEAVKAEGNIELSRFFAGKSQAFFVASAWVLDNLVGEER